MISRQTYQALLFLPPLTLGILFFLFQPLSAQESALRIEPPNWWVGMANDTLQVMIYGKDVARESASIEEYRGVTLLSIQTVKNPNYLFLNILVTDQARPGQIQFLIGSPVGEKRVPYTLKAREDSSTKQPITPKDAIYLITPDRFSNGKSENDNLPEMKEGTDRQNINGRHGGDLEGIRKHIEYLKELGITALWINPALKNDMPNASYHGYAITDFYAIDPRFGSNQEYFNLCREANAAGIKIIADMVVNHCGSEHWWMKDPPDEGWINYSDKPYQQTNHLKTTTIDLYASQEDTEGLVRGWFVPSMPDLNTEHPILSKYLINNTLWWIEQARLSGIRMDTYPYSSKTFMATWARRIRTEYPGFFLVGEVWHYEPALIARWQDQENTTEGYRSWLPYVFDFPLQGAIRTAFTEPEGWEQGIYKLYEAASLDFLYPAPNHLVTFADNHDMTRVFTALGGDVMKTKNAIAFLLTFRGLPALYYGTEILMDHPGTDAHGAIRADFPGGWPKDSTDAFTGRGLNSTASSFQAWIKKLLNWRRTADVVHEGKITHYAPQNGIYVLFRYTENKKIMVIIRKDNNPTRLDLSRFTSMLAGIQHAKDVLTGNTYRIQEELNLINGDPLILELN